MQIIPLIVLSSVQADPNLQPKSIIHLCNFLPWPLFALPLSLSLSPVELVADSNRERASIL